MFRVRVDAQETYRSSIRPVMVSSIRHLMKHFGFDKDILTFFSGESEISRMIGTNFTTKTRTDQDTDVGYYDRQFVTAEQDVAGVNDELDSSGRWITNHPFWRDPETESMIVPMFVTRKYNMSINRYFKDRVTANQYRDHIQNTLTNPNVNTFNTTVHYPISYQMMNCFETIYSRLVEAGIVDKDKVNALDWFKANCTVPSDIVTNLIGNNPVFVFKRSLDGISLLFNGVNITRSQKGKYQGQHLVTLEYSFYLSEHTRYELHYPITVYQQMTEAKYIPQFDRDVLDDYPSSHFYESQMAASHKDLYMKHSAPFMFVFPDVDNFRPPFWKWMDLMLQRLALMEDTEDQNVLNLFTFNGETGFWDSTFEKYIKKFHNKVTIRHRNPMHIRIWSDDVGVEELHVTMDETGNIFLKHKPTMKAAYRVTFYLDNATWLYDEECIRDIIEDEDYGRWIIDKIMPWLPLPGDPDYHGDKKPGDYPWIDWDKDIDGRVPNGDNPYDNDRRKIYMMDALIIAKNEGVEADRPGTYVLEPSMSDYLRRKY